MIGRILHGIRQAQEDWEAIGKVRQQAIEPPRIHHIAAASPAPARNWYMGELTDPDDVADPRGGW